MRFPSLLIRLVPLVWTGSLLAQDDGAPTPPRAGDGPSQAVSESHDGTSLATESDGQPSLAGENEPERESSPSAAAEAFVVPAQMAVFEGHVGGWKGMTKTQVTEDGVKTLTRTRSEWTGGYLLGGHAFEMRGYSYGELGRTEYRWQYTYDALKERYIAAYYDSHGRTYFCEGKINVENTKIIWRLLAPPGDMTWHAETDLHPEDGLETNGRIASDEFRYDMVYSSVYKKASE